MVKDRATKEVEAESISFVVSTALHLPTDSSFGYIAGWSQERKIEAVKDSLNTIQATSSDILCKMERILYPEKSLHFADDVQQHHKVRAV